MDRVLEALEDGATTNELMGAVNLGKGRIEAMLKVLDVEGAVAREGTQWVRVPGSDWHYDGDRYAHVTALRRREQEAMAAFGADGRCLMRALREELDDPDPPDCGVCAVCTAPRFAGPLDPALVRDAVAAPALQAADPRRQEDGARRRGQDEASSATTCAPRRAARSRGSATAAGTRWSRPAGATAASTTSWSAAAAEAVRTWRAPVRWVAAVPSERSGELVPDFAQRLAEALEPPVPSRCSSASATTRRSARWPTPRSRSRTSAASSRSPRRRRRTRCLLVDDVRFSGWTLAMVAGQLRRKGASAGLPARALHRLLGLKSPCEGPS